MASAYPRAIQEHARARRRRPAPGRNIVMQAESSITGTCTVIGIRYTGTDDLRINDSLSFIHYFFIDPPNKKSVIVPTFIESLPSIPATIEEVIASGFIPLLTQL